MKKGMFILSFIFTTLLVTFLGTTSVYAANEDHFYQFERTASGTAVYDGASLRLDGTNQIRDDYGGINGNPVSLDGINFGTYESSDGTTAPVAVSEIHGITGNSYFAKLNNSNKEGINLGDFDAGAGLTFEGWFKPTGIMSDAPNNGRLVTKRTYWQAGNFWVTLNSNGGVTFGVYNDNGNYYQWNSANYKVDWTKWNYIAVTWQKNYRFCDFYIKPAGGTLYHETIYLDTFSGSFPNTSDMVSIGYTAGFDAGFTGYMDEVRLSNYRKHYTELLLEQNLDLVQSNGSFSAQIDANGDPNMPTFGSFNRHIVEIKGIYYASYLDSNRYIRIVQSVDGGQTWSNLYGPGQHIGDQPAVIDSDNNGRLHVVWTSNEVGYYMRFSGSPLTKDIDITAGSCSTKFAMVYNPAADLLYWSHRENGDVYLKTLDTSGNVQSNIKIINHIGVAGQPNEYWDAQYQSIYCDSSGRLHMIYSAHYWPNATDWSTYTRKKVLYMYSDDHGQSWKKADGSSIGIPFDVNDFTKATEISTEPKAIGSNILVTGNKIHILYSREDGIPGLKYVRLNRSTGASEQNYFIPGINMHSILVMDPNSNNLYIVTEDNFIRPALYKSTDAGDNWSLYSVIDQPPTQDIYFSATGTQKVTGGSILCLTTDWGYSSGARNVDFYKFRVDASNYYRFEQTASGTTAVYDGASLRLDGTYQVKDQLGSQRNGNPVSLNGSSFGTYESADGSVTPVPYSNIKGAASNSFYAKLNSSNKEGIDLGDFDVGTGLTVEGWFKPTGSMANGYSNARLITKRSNWQAGNFWAFLNSSGGVTFGVYTNNSYYEWNSSNNQVDWTKWNYIAFTWNKNSNQVDFYVKPLNGVLYHETIINSSYSGTFPNSSDTVSIGYSAGFDLGFDGYADEVRLSDFKMRQDELMLNN